MYEKKNALVIRSAFIAALGGLLFGFDTAVISGAEREIQALFELNGFWHGLTVAIALIGTVFGAIFAGKPADKYGRKQVLIVLAFLYGFSALGCAFAGNWIPFMTFRFLGGLGVGASSVIGPMYIAEIAPAKLRGRLVGLFQLNVVSGILLAFLSNYLIANLVQVDAWRYMLGIQVIPSAIFFGLLFLIPATPRWLVLKGKKDEALKLLGSLASPDPKQELDDIIASIEHGNNGSNERLFQKQYSIPILLAFAIAFFNQMSGINAIMYYAPRIFEMSGFNTGTALFSSVSIGMTNLVFTLLAMSIIDKFGRKKLLLVGSVGMVFFLTMVAKTFLGDAEGSRMVLIYLIGFIAFFAFSQGAVIWVFISEIFPNSVRAKGQTLGSLTHWVMAMLVSWLFPVIAEGSINGGAIVFFIFGGSMLVQLIVVKKWFPETKGKTLESIQKEMTKS